MSFLCSSVYKVLDKLCILNKTHIKITDFFENVLQNDKNGSILTLRKRLSDFRTVFRGNNGNFKGYRKRVRRFHCDG